MKLKDITHIFLALSIIVYVCVNTFTTKDYVKRITYLENKLDSLIVNNNNYSYSHIITFVNKTPEEGIDEALIYYGIEHPTIVKAQAILETAHFTSDLCIKNNNLFGLYDSKNKRYYSYNHWWESIIAYKKTIQKRYENSRYYYMFLEDIEYAEDKEYINKLKEIAEGLE